MKYTYIIYSFTYILKATQIITASEDDGAPILELWDLRNTYSPAKTFEGHTRGIWSVSWCPMDSDLLLTCGKDNRTLCWYFHFFFIFLNF